MPRDPLAFGSSFPALTDDCRRRARGCYHPRLVELRSYHASGVYVIYDARTRECLYVGESHSGRLYDTLTRHFRAWEPEDDPQGRRRGGTMYDRRRVRVGVQLTGDDEAPDHQYAAILAFEPRDNRITGTADMPDDAPF